MRVVTWNLFHGRSVPQAGRDLLDEFSQLLAGWSWDVALLQEVPPWWPERLARDAGAEQRSVLTSRNSLPALRRAIARRRPDLIKSNGGGCNALLSRSPFAEHRSLRLRLWPERRVAQLARLQNGVVIGNVHASTRVPLAEEELRRLSRLALEWTEGAPLVLGGDLNLRRPEATVGEQLTHVAARDVDHLFTRGLRPLAPATTLDRHVALDDSTVELSDHPPLQVELA